MEVAAYALGFFVAAVLCVAVLLLQSIAHSLHALALIARHRFELDMRNKAQAEAPYPA